MKTRLLLLALLATAAAHAELKLFLWSGGTETPATSFMKVGSAAIGETLEVRFRARNTGPDAVTIQKLSAEGSGFSLYGPFDLPYVIAPGNFVNIFIHFQPKIAGTASVPLVVNSITVMLIAEGTGEPVIETGSVTTTNGTVIDWGPVERNKTKPQTITLKNLSAAAATVNQIDVKGDAFYLAAPVPTPVTVEVNQSFSFDIVFQPRTDGAQQGTLLVDGRTYTLRGTGVAPAPAQPRLVVDATASSSQQLKLRVSLTSESKTPASGTVEMQFLPATGLANDPTVQFLPAGRMATVTVQQGESLGRFNGNDSITFQTGTTAGQIIFSLKLAGYTSQAALTIAPSIVVLDKVYATRESGRVVIQLFGYDNVRTADQLSFTFYDSGGRFLGNGAIRVSAGEDFRKFFQASAAGGAFNLLAAFPVSGDVKIIDSVDVVITNSSGSTATNHASF